MRSLLLTGLLFVSSVQGFAQCAMCRTTLENNLSNGDPGMAAGINTGILYLLALPYLIAIVLGYFWYKSSRNVQQKQSSGHAAG